MPESSRPARSLDAFFVELDQLEAEIRAELSSADLDHLKHIERIGRACTALGWATAWMGPNLFSALLIAQGRTTRWTTVAHHISHGGYSRVPDVPTRYTRQGFARGSRRWLDWFDVIGPEGWHAEHNVLHHSRTSDEADPDLVEQNLDWLRKSDLPMPARYALVVLMASAWKWIYYAPNTTQEAFVARGASRVSLRDRDIWDPTRPMGRALWLRSLLPYAGMHFLLLPALFAPLGAVAVSSAAINSLLAEWITNLHTFAIITTNHCGDDVHAFDGPPTSRREYLLRQIMGSVNMSTGDDRTDLLHGWLNYQIEHHVWPDLTLLQYRSAQPRLKKLCERHGIPYVQESVFRRVKKTVDLMVGKADMQRVGMSPSTLHQVG